MKTNTFFEREDAFTMIELLVVTAVIAILAMVTVPLFSLYRQRSYDAQSRTDLTNAALGEEAYYANTQRYTDCYGLSGCQALLPGFRGSEGTILSMYVIPAARGNPESFTGSAYHPLGLRNNSQYACYWNAQNGGLQ